MLDVKINSFCPQDSFYGAYEARKKQNFMKEIWEKAKASEDLPRESFQEKYGATVTISAESQEFLAHARERKEAARAEREAAAANQPQYSNSFEGTGDFRAQYLVLSENLYRNGFYDNLSDEEVKDREDMLKEITASMNSINGGIIDLSTQISHESAKVELSSSVKALNYFADKYVPEEMRDSFQEVIGQYEEYNRSRIKNYKSMEDLHNENARDQSAPNIWSSNEMVRKIQEVTRARVEIKNVTHTEQEEETQQAKYEELFDQLLRKEDSPANVFAKMQKSLVEYASGGSKNSMVIQLLNKQNSQSFNRMAAYWTRLL